MTCHILSEQKLQKYFLPLYLFHVVCVCVPLQCQAQKMVVYMNCVCLLHNCGSRLPVCSSEVMEHLTCISKHLLTVCSVDTNFSV